MGGRFEYRIFGKDLNAEKAYLEKHYKSIGEKETQEVYLLSKKTHEYNIKIKDNKLDVKILNASIENFEQWDLLYKKDFPVQGACLNFLFKREIASPDLYLSKTAVKAFVSTKEYMKLVFLKKKRTLFEEGEVRGEFAVVEVENKIFHTVAFESYSLKNLKKATKELDLENSENINYYKFLQELAWAKPAVSVCPAEN